MIRKILTLSFLVNIVLLFGACTSNQPTFTPSVLEKPPETKVVDNPTEASNTEPGESTPSPVATNGGTEAVETEILSNTEEAPLLDATKFPNPENYQWEEIASGFSKPLGMTSYYDDTLLIYILEQGGVIRVLENDTLLNEPFLDISNKVTTRGSEQGLLGIALDPEYESNGEFYLNYTDRGGNTVIARYIANLDKKTADVKSEQILLKVEQPYSNHNGGNLVFGPDGFLYIGLGDGGSGGDPELRAQNTDTLLGKMLRIAVSDQEIYSIPSDNPYVDGGGRAEIWSIGLRNPWRYSFDKTTGDLWIADVGQGNWEEINFTQTGSLPELNYGWSYFEGTHPFKGDPTNPEEFIYPVFEYDHSMGCSVTGGYVYRGEELPEWYGIYIFGDFCNGKVWGILSPEDGTWQSSELFNSGLNISSFGEDVFGELYMIAHNGTLYRLSAK